MMLRLPDVRAGVEERSDDAEDVAEQRVFAGRGVVLARGDGVGRDDAAHADHADHRPGEVEPGVPRLQE